MHPTMPSGRVLAGLVVLWAASAVLTVTVLEWTRPPSQLPSVISRVPRTAEQTQPDSIPALDLSPVGRGAYLLDGPTLVGVGLDSASAEQARRTAKQEGFHWLPRSVGGVHVYDPATRMELRLRRYEFPQGYVLLAPAQMPARIAGRLDMRALRQQLAAYRGGWMGRQTPS